MCASDRRACESGPTLRFSILGTRRIAHWLSVFWTRPPSTPALSQPLVRTPELCPVYRVLAHPVPSCPYGLVPRIRGYAHRFGLSKHCKLCPTTDECGDPGSVDRATPARLLAWAMGDGSGYWVTHPFPPRNYGHHAVDDPDTDTQSPGPPLPHCCTRADVRPSPEPRPRTLARS